MVTKSTTLVLYHQQVAGSLRRHIPEICGWWCPGTHGSTWLAQREKTSGKALPLWHQGAGPQHTEKQEDMLVHCCSFWVIAIWRKTVMSDLDLFLFCFFSCYSHFYCVSKIRCTSLYWSVLADMFFFVNTSHLRSFYLVLKSRRNYVKCVML